MTSETHGLRPRVTTDAAKAAAADYSPWMPSDSANWQRDKYAVCTPYFGNPDLGHIDCYVPVRKYFDTFRTVGCSYIDQARAALGRTR